MKTCRELLELAAKAAGMGDWVWDEQFLCMKLPHTAYTLAHTQKYWNPLVDDGDALRLAVKLGFAIRVLEKCVFVESDPETLLAFSEISQLEMFSGDPYAATRRAIVRAAAEIGRGMRPSPSVEEIKQWVGQDDV